MSDSPGSVLRGGSDGRVLFFCPGCQEPHTVTVGEGHAHRWSWNGDDARPTFAPSILIRTGHYCASHKPGDNCWCTYNADNPDAPVSFACAICHSFVRDGSIQFLGDCTHALAGQTVPLPPWEPGT